MDELFCGSLLRVLFILTRAFHPRTWEGFYNVELA